ncbi:MAG: hypothetical protein ROR55_19975 [Devosia sp.]
MALAHRQTDVNSGGGAITDVPQDFVFDQGLLVSVDGSIGTSHPPCPLDPVHCQGNWVTANGADWVRINGIPVNRTGDADTCGHVRAGTDSIIDIIG